MNNDVDIVKTSYHLALQIKIIYNNMSKFYNCV
jgi:hypothetical protein